MKQIRLAIVLTVLSILLLQGAAAESLLSLLPVIEKLDYTDLNYRQLQEDISFFYRASSARKELPPMLLYIYRVESGENIFTLSSQAGLPYDTVASLNRIPSSSADLEGKTIILPSQAGIFLPAEPSSDIEFISLSWRAPSLSEAETIIINDDEYYFFPDQSYHNVERAYFLGILFTNPLPKGIVTSGYGLRTSPFTGNHMFHKGIDIAAPTGTYVFAARGGEVIAEGTNSTYGNYIEIQHEGGYTSFYGHLNKIFVELHDKVNSTMIIAEVGNTGLSTGPHLHFEIRRDGSSKDPSKLTPGLD